MTARIIPLRSPDIWVKARKVARDRAPPLEDRARLLTAVMAATLASAGADLAQRRHCHAVLAGLYVQGDVDALLDAAIEAAEALGEPEAKLKLARAL